MNSPELTSLGAVAANGAGAAVFARYGDHTLTCSVSGVGSVSAVVAWQGSNDLMSWVTIDTLNLTGTDLAASGSATARTFGYWRMVVSSLTGAGARVQGTVATESGASSSKGIPVVQDPVSKKLFANDAEVSVGATAAQQPRVLKEFSDLIGVAFTSTSATYVAAIDQDSPFGCPALKLDITFSAGGRVEIGLPAQASPAFDDHVAWAVHIDDATKVGSIVTFVGTSGYAKYRQCSDPIFSGGIPIAGPRVFVNGPLRQTNVVDGGFVFGTDTLQEAKIRITTPNPIVPGEVTTIWIKDAIIPARQACFGVLSWDDGFDSWSAIVAPALAKWGFKGTFGINSDQIDKGVLGITSANVQALCAQGHQVTTHGVQNYRLQTLLGSGNGRQVGAGAQSQAVDVYVGDARSGQRSLEPLGAQSPDAMYFPWIQGGADTAGAVAMWAAGVDMIRGTAPYEPVVYGMPQWGNTLYINAIELASSRTLAQAKAQVDLAKKYGALFWTMGHQTGPVADATTWTQADLEAFIDYVGSLGIPILTGRGARDKLQAAGWLRARSRRVSRQPVQQIGRLTAANFNITTDQAIALLPGSWVVTGVYATAVSTSLGASAAAGGVYSAAAKGGTAVVAATQGYTGMTGATDVVGCTMAAKPTVSGSVYLALSTAHGSAATADIFVFGRPA